MTHLKYKTGAVSVFFLAVLVTVAYFNTVYNGFVYDDNVQILMNPWIRDFSHLYSIFTSHSFAFLDKPVPGRSFRPFVFAIYSVEYALFGLRPMGWHVINIVLHTVNTALVYLLIIRLLPLSGAGKGAGNTFWEKAAPFAGAALFAVHPINNEVVAWVGCVPELIYTLLTLGALHLYILSDEGVSVARAYGLRFAGGVLFLFALFSKETAVVLPLLVFAYDTLVRRRRVFSLRFAARYVPFFAGGLAYSGMRLHALGAAIPGDKMYGYLSPGQYVLNAVVFFGRYMRLLIVPAGDHPFELFLHPVLSWAAPVAIASVFAAAVMLAAVAYLCRRRPLYGFSLVLLILPLLPALYIPGLSRHAFAIRYLYLPSAGLGLLAALLLKRFGEGGIARGAASKALVAGIMAVLVVFIILTVQRNRPWKDDTTVWTASAAAQEGNYFAHYWLGEAYYKRKMYGEAIREAKVSLRMMDALVNKDRYIGYKVTQVLANAYMDGGQYADAVREYGKLLRIRRHDFTSTYNLAFSYQQQGFYAEAIEAYKQALQLAKKPDDTKDTFINLANCYARTRRYKESLAVYAAALRYFPGDPTLLHNMDVVRRLSGSGDR